MTKDSSQNLQRKCYYCGTTHKKQACPAYRKKCLKCKKLKHFASVCRSKYKINVINATNSNTGSHVDINELNIDHVGSSVITKDNEITLDATVNDFNTTFKLETGAQCNIIPIATFNKTKNKPKLLKTKATLKGYGGHNIDIVGKCNMMRSLSKKNWTCEFFIVNTKYTKPLFGLKTCQDLSVINMYHITTKP